MLRAILITLAAMLIGFAAADTFAAELTAAEQRWVDAMAPVIGYAAQDGLPLDIVVQPQDEPQAPPLQLGFADGRCKLVLSMRNNPRVPAALNGLPSCQLTPSARVKT